MARSLPPVPYRDPVTLESGLVASVWATWFREIFARTGGTNAKNNNELQTNIVTNETNIELLNVDMETLVTKTAELETKISELETKNTLLEARIEALEGT